MDFGFIFDRMLDKAKEAISQSDALRTLVTAVIYEGVVISTVAALLGVRELKDRPSKRNCFEFDEIDDDDPYDVILSNEWGW